MVFLQEGDLKIGFIMNTQVPYSGEKLCGGPIALTLVQHMEVVVKTVADINARDDILPNINMGLVVLDGCRTPKIALARASYFIPDEVTCILSSNSSDTCPADKLIDPEQRELIERQTHYDVVGIIGPGWSSQAVPVSSLFSLFEIPIISQSASSSELSDKSRYEYFSRIQSPDNFMAIGIVDMILHFEWTYIIVLYSEGSYGETLSKQIEKGLKGTGVCFAISHRIPSDADEEEYNWIVDQLEKETEARIVVGFMEIKDSVAITLQMIKRKIDNKYIYLSGSWFYSTSTTQYGMREGSVFFDTLPVDVPGFNEYFPKRQPWMDPINPWLLQLWEEQLHCSWDVSKQDNTSCYQYEGLEGMPSGYHSLEPSSLAARTSDSVFVFADSLHRLITDHCPGVFNNPALAKDCIKGNMLLQYIRQTEVNGVSGLVSFDENGDLRVKYILQQVQKDGKGGYTTIIVGEWDSLSPNNRLNIDMDILDFSMIMSNEILNGTEQILKSVCSEPCPPRHSIVRGDIPCCWECHECRPNEVLIRNGTKCESCDQNTWPDDVTGDICVDIYSSYLKWTSPISISLLSIASFGFAVSVAVIVVFQHRRKHKLVRATSRGLSNLVLCGTTLVCLDVFLVVSQPTKTVCLIRRAAFHLGVTLVYGPLLIKTIRIYRVFTYSLKGRQKIQFASANQQIIMAVIVICLQVSRLQM